MLASYLSSNASYLLQEVGQYKSLFLLFKSYLSYLSYLKLISLENLLLNFKYVE